MARYVEPVFRQPIRSSSATAPRSEAGLERAAVFGWNDGATAAADGAREGLGRSDAPAGAVTEGAPLPDPVRTAMESSFGADLQPVRVHSGPRGAERSRGDDTLACTEGEHIHVGEKASRLSTRQGIDLLGHEIAHVLQQRAGRSRPAIGAAASSARLEAEADVAGFAAARGERAPTLSPAQPGHAQLKTGDAKPHESPILYFGLNPNADVEARAVQTANAAYGGTIPILSVAGDTLTVNGQRLDLSEDANVVTVVRMLGLDPASDAGKKVRELIGATSVRDEMARMMLTFREAERGGREFERIVLSGHGSPWTLSGTGRGSLKFDDIIAIAMLFRGAARKVRHIMFSSCFSSGALALNDWQAAFPALQTIWSYNEFSPEAGKGAETAIARWASKTHDPDVTRIEPDGNKITTWSATAGVITLGKPLPLARLQANLQAKDDEFQEYFDGEKDSLDPYSGNMVDYYFSVNRVIQHPEFRLLPDNERDSVRKRGQQALRLRFYYRSIRGHFAEKYQPILRAGYQALKQPLPDFAALDRKATLAEIRRLGELGDLPGPTRQALELLQAGLRDLDPSYALQEWL